MGADAAPVMVNGTPQEEEDSTYQDYLKGQLKPLFGISVYPASCSCAGA